MSSRYECNRAAIEAISLHFLDEEMDLPLIDAVMEPIYNDPEKAATLINGLLDREGYWMDQVARTGLTPKKLLRMWSTELEEVNATGELERDMWSWRKFKNRNGNAKPE